MSRNYEQISDGRYTWNEHLRDGIFSTVHAHVFCAYRSKLDSNWNAGNARDTRARLYFIEDGEAEVSHNNRVFRMVPGSLYLIPAHTLHGHRCDNYLDVSWCHFSVILHSGIDLFDIFEPEYEYRPEKPADIRSLFSRLVDWNSRDCIESAMVRTGLLLQLLAPFVSSIRPEQIASSRTSVEKFDAALKFIEGNLSGRISVSGLARAVSMSTSCFSRLFVGTFGITPAKYIMRRRIENAQVLLMTTDTTIDVLGTELGFNDGFHFSKAFKKHTGVSPSRYRDLYQAP